MPCSESYAHFSELKLEITTKFIWRLNDILTLIEHWKYESFIQAVYKSSPTFLFSDVSFMPAASAMVSASAAKSFCR